MKSTKSVISLKDEPLSHSRENGNQQLKLLQMYFYYFLAFEIVGSHPQRQCQ